MWLYGVRLLTRVMLSGVPLLLQAQSRPADIWSGISSTPTHLGTEVSRIPETAKTQVRRVLAFQGLQHSWECPLGDPEAEWLQNLQFYAIDVNQNENVLLVQAGAGCARGGQGANGAMWIVRLNKGQGVSVLADPDHGFSGWVYDIAPTVSHSYRDIVVGWHLGAAESGLSYFRFDGHRYQSIGKAEAHFVDNSHVTIVPEHSHPNP